MSKKGLTPRQEAFVRALVSGKTQVQAYKDAGYKTDRYSYDIMCQKASALLNGKVLVRYKQLIGEAKDNAVVTRTDDIKDLCDKLREMTKIKLSDVVQVDRNGNIRIIDPELRGVKSARFDMHGHLIGVEMYDVQGAIDKLIRMLGGYRDKVEMNMTVQWEDIVRKIEGDEF